ncbi:uncharacterized protein DUF4292 [Anseongella ginsenosidimutans]|uniref:Uncharacterized protein DUF4292 n=1 Tax=Anseongella ginsenosidimutans TaxID=496056 RepID=A0A4R3KYD9_9SPHI|nr:DUF4292 domain-containing protein [Anseongella ginsenosidimutans]QEC51030.1 DUF4292 domain-containing protein [Anseongella ginsenosidimutans]TCS90314.1 uncharacterized protein DUF4292 [Anseongella ginsenosidimutans]
MNKRYLTCFILLLLLAGGCKTRKKAVEGRADAGDRLVRKEKEVGAFHEAVQRSDLEFSWLAARGKAEIADGNRNYQVSLNLRMQKDKVIWASVTAILGLEVARAMITPDSIKFFNRLERTYVSQDLDYLREHVHPGISFALLESALTGNSPRYLMESKGQLWEMPGGYRLEGVEELFSYLLRFNQDYKVEKISIREKASGGNFNVDYHNFENRSGKWIPRSVSFTSDASEKELSIHLTYDTFSLNEPQDFPFTVPGRYKRMQ